MKLAINRIDLLSELSEATMSHQGQEIKWSISLFEKTSFKGEFDLFEQINGYWASLSLDTQGRIFNVYHRIREVFDEVWDTDKISNMSQLTGQLYPLVTELYTFHDLDNLDHWLKFHGNVMTPPSFKEEFIESHDNPGTRARTYTKGDYQQLVVLTVAVRAMIPVWGEFISKTKKEAGNNFKEYYAFKLLSFSSMYHSPAMERLKDYVQASLPTDKSFSAAIFGGISSEDFPLWILGMVVVRRLSVGDVRGLDPTSSLVTFIYKYIGQKVKGHESNFIGAVKDKPTEGSGTQEGENNLSKLEGYKEKQELPQGDISMISHHLSNLRQIAQNAAPGMDFSLVEQSLATVAHIHGRVSPAQMALIQWIYRGANPRGLLYVSRKQVLEAMAVTQAALWDRGHHDLAALVSAVVIPNDGEIQLTGVDARSRVPKETIDLLAQLYPHPKRVTGKPKTTRQTSAGLSAIEEMDRHFSEFSWRLTLPPDWVQRVTGNRNNRRYSTPFDIRIKLANLVVSLAQRSF